MQKSEFLDLMNQYIKIHNQFTAIKRNQLCSIDEESYYPAEMHVLTLLSRNPQYTITDIAENLYITKSAASQIVKKLASKGLIEKIRDIENERVVILSIPEKGERAIKHFIEFESESFAGFFNEISEIEANELEIIKKFLNKLEYMFDQKLD